MSRSDRSPVRAARDAPGRLVQALLAASIGVAGPALAEPAPTGPGVSEAPVQAPAPEVPAPTVPFGWIREAPTADPLLGAQASRLVARLGIPEAERAEALYGPPSEGKLRGWWLRPIGPLRSGAWLLMSAAGGLYAVVGPPGLVDDPGFVALSRAGRRWAAILRGR